MANVKMGFEGLLYYGTAGSTATNLLENTKDITVNLEVERADTTVRGDSSAPPIGTEDVTKRMLGIEFTMIHDITDTYFSAMMTAANSGTAVALRGKDYSAGKGPDADFTLSVSQPQELEGAQVVTFTCSPTRAAGRSPSRYV